MVDYAREAGWILRDRHCYDRETLSNMPWNGILSIALRPALSDWIRQWDCPVVRMLCGTLPDDAPVVETDSRESARRVQSTCSRWGKKNICISVSVKLMKRTWLGMDSRKPCWLLDATPCV